MTKKIGQGSTAAPGPIALLRASLTQTSRVTWRLLLVIAVSQIALTFVAFPLIRFLFAEALRANGMLAVDTDQLWIGRGFPITVLLLVVMLLLLIWVLILQFSAYMVVLHSPGLTRKQLWTEILQIGRKVFSRSAGLMSLYLLVVLPLSGFGFTSAALSNIAVPNFITGELEKDTVGQILVFAGYALIFYMNIRLCLTLPIFAFSDEGGTASLKASWHLTRGLSPWPVVVSVALLLLALSVVSVGLFYLTLAPTLLADAVAPAASPIVAAFGYGGGVVLALLLWGYGAAILAGILMAYTESTSDLVTPSGATESPAVGSRSRNAALGVLVVSFLALGVTAIPTMTAVADHPSTIVVGHRGFTQGGVENTIEALEAAHAAGAEIVETDVMQTKDGQFVIMHDTDLGRLAGKKVQVKDLTLDELTQIEVHDNAGHTGKIPSLVEYAGRAKELGQPLLLEIKLGGAETDTHVQDLVAVLEENDLMDGNLFHSLDSASVETLKNVRPDTTVGYIMPFAGVGLPDTNADFLVVEESWATPAMQQRANNAGLGFVVWTVDDQDAMKVRFRHNVHAIITDRTDLALTTREGIREETGLAGRLHDTMIGLFTG